jgi:hypothetical protein
MPTIAFHRYVYSNAKWVLDRNDCPLCGANYWGRFRWLNSTELLAGCLNCHEMTVLEVTEVVER